MFESILPQSACAAACGADLLPLTSTGSRSVRVQVILSSLGFVGCGRMTMCHLQAACSLERNDSCSIDFQLWHSNTLGGLALKSNSSFRDLPLSTGGAVHNLSIPLDMEFTTGDVVGFGFSNDLSINRFDVHTASAPNHSYLQWMTSGTTLSMQDATTVEPSLPILSVEGM